MRVVGQILLVERKTKLGVQLCIRSNSKQDFFQLLFPTSKHWIRLYGSGLDAQLERSQTSLVGLLGHAVMNRLYTSMEMKMPTCESLLLLLSQWLTAVQEIATGTLCTRNVIQATSMKDANRIGRPGSRKVQTRTHFG